MFQRFRKEDKNGEQTKKAKESAPQKLRMGLSRTRTSLLGRIGNLLSRKTRIDSELLDEMEEILIQSDIGVDTTLKLMSHVRERVKEEKLEGTPDAVIQLLKDELVAIL